MSLPETNVKQLIAFHERCIRIVYDSEENGDELPSVMNVNKIRAYKLVRKCIDNEISDIFKTTGNIQKMLTRV